MTTSSQSRHPGPPLRDLRRIAGLTQAETAKLAGVSAPITRSLRLVPASAAGGERVPQSCDKEGSA